MKKLLVCWHCGRVIGGVDLSKVTKPIDTTQIFTVDRGGRDTNDFPFTASYRDMRCGGCFTGPFESDNILRVADADKALEMGLTDDLTQATERYVIEREQKETTHFDKNQELINSLDEGQDKLSCKHCGKEYAYKMHLTTHEKKCRG